MEIDSNSNIDRFVSVFCLLNNSRISLGKFLKALVDVSFKWCVKLIPTRISHVYAPSSIPYITPAYTVFDLEGVIESLASEIKIKSTKFVFFVYSTFTHLHVPVYYNPCKLI